MGWGACLDKPCRLGFISHTTNTELPACLYLLQGTSIPADWKGWLVRYLLAWMRCQYTCWLEIQVEWGEIPAGWSGQMKWGTRYLRYLLAGMRYQYTCWLEWKILLADSSSSPICWNSSQLGCSHLIQSENLGVHIWFRVKAGVFTFD